MLSMTLAKKKKKKKISKFQQISGFPLASQVNTEILNRYRVDNSNKQFFILVDNNDIKKGERKREREKKSNFLGGGWGCQVYFYKCIVTIVSEICPLSTQYLFRLTFHVWDWQR